MTFNNTQLHAPGILDTKSPKMQMFQNEKINGPLNSLQAYQQKRLQIQKKSSTYYQPLKKNDDLTSVFS